MRRFMLIALVCTAGVSAVDRSKFRTCAQTSFCSRNRNVQPAHKFKLGQLTVAGGRVTADLLPSGHAAHQHHVQPLDFEIVLYATKAARVRVTEKSPPMVRWENPDVILPDQALCPDVSVSNDHAMSRVMCSGDAVLSVNHDTFQIDLLQPDGVVVASTNARGMFYFEQQRGQKGQALGGGAEQAKVDEREILDWGEDGKPIYADGSEADAAEDESAADEAVAETAVESYEEKFGSHTDTRPHGPMSVGVDISFPAAAQVYGIPEHATDMALKHTRGGPYTEPYRLYTLDVFEYELDNPMALYGAIPVMLAHGVSEAQPCTAAVFWHNPSEAFIDVEAGPGGGKATQWMSESGVFDLFLFRGPSPAAFFSAYSALTGTQTLPPLFAVAYHQCRWNYRDEKDVDTVDAKFEELNFPYDVLWLDIEHTDGKRYFTWDADKFPNPAPMQERLASRGHKMVTIVDPHIKRDTGFGLHTEATAQGHYVKNKDGGDFDGWCWPGSSSYLDFTTSKVRDFWASWFGFDKYKGSTPSLHTWNDMNEPSVFNGPEVSMPKDAKNLAGVEHREWHNMYGFYQQMATMLGLERRNEPERNERGFVLSRAFFAGSQRYGAIWTGDNAAEWSHLKIATPMLLTQGLAGFPFAGADTGGFFGNPDQELLVRWYQAAAYQPFFRAHAHIDTKRREPWLFGAETLALTRAAVLSRYALLPFVYSVFEESSRNGLPIMRALWLEFPADERTFTMDEAFMLGGALLVQPVTRPGTKSAQVYLPGTAAADVWYDVDDLWAAAGGQAATVETPIQKMPVFQRGGTVVPRQRRVRRASAMMINDPYTLTVALGTDGGAQGELYLDDTHSYDFRRGVFTRRALTWSGTTAPGGRCTLVGSAAAGGGYSPKNTVERVEVLGVAAAPTAVTATKGEGLGAPVALGFTYDAKSKSLLIRKPDVQVAFDFEIELKF